MYIMFFPFSQNVFCNVSAAFCSQVAIQVYGCGIYLRIYRLTHVVFLIEMRYNSSVVGCFISVCVKGAVCKF